MEKSDVERRIEEWEKRLEELYARVEDWFHQLPPAEPHQFLRGRTLQNEEELMRRFDVPSRMLPTCAVLYGRNRVSFVPSALWVIGANGRLNVTTNTRQFVLLDMASPGEAANWQVVVSRLEEIHRPFDQQVFEDLVVRQALEVA